MELTDREKAMDRSDRRCENILAVLAILALGWSACVNVGCLFDPFRGLPAEELRRTIEDTDWDAVP